MKYVYICTSCDHPAFFYAHKPEIGEQLLPSLASHMDGSPMGDEELFRCDHCGIYPWLVLRNFEEAKP